MQGRSNLGLPTPPLVLLHCLFPAPGLHVSAVLSVNNACVQGLLLHIGSMSTS